MLSQRMIIVRIFKEKAKRRGHCDQRMMCHTEARAVSEYDKALGENALWNEKGTEMQW